MTALQILGVVVLVVCCAGPVVGFLVWMFRDDREAFWVLVGVFAFAITFVGVLTLGIALASGDLS